MTLIAFDTMNKLPQSQRAAILRGMVEGNSVRSITRMTGVSKGAVLRLLVEVGEFCAVYLDYKLRKLPCIRIEADEAWGFCGAKEKNATKAGQGDLWTYTAICADSKLLVSRLVVVAATLRIPSTSASDVASRPCELASSAFHGRPDLLSRGRGERLWWRCRLRPAHQDVPRAARRWWSAPV